MDERDERDERQSQRAPAEGVRIIGAEEAQAALDAGQAAGRRSEDELRFGDVPPSPSGPRSPHRFPLPDSVDPAAAVPRPAVVAPVESEERTGGIRRVRRRRAPQATTPEVSLPEPWDPPATSDDGGSGSGGWTGEDGFPPSDDDRSWDATSTQVQPRADWGGPPADSLTAAVGDAEVAAAGTEPYAPTAWAGEQAVTPPYVAPSAGETWPATGAAESASFDPGLTRASASYQGDPYGGPAPSETSPGDPPTAPQPEWSEDARWSEPPEATPWGGPATWAATGATGEPAVEPAGWPGDAPGGAESWTEPATAQWSGAGYQAGDDLRARPDDGGSSPMTTPDLAPPEEGITVGGPDSGPPLPHWTDPPTGEIPRVLRDTEAEESDDDLSAWEALGAKGLRWRDGAADWGDVDEMRALGGDEAPLGALDTSRTDHSDLYSFDDDFNRLEEGRTGAHPVYVPEAAPEEEPEPVAIRTGMGATSTPRRATNRNGDRKEGSGRTSKTGSYAAAIGGGGRDLRSAVVVGIGLLVLLGIAYGVGSRALVVLSALAVTACGSEFYGQLRHAGVHAAQLLGVVGIGGVMLAAYWRGEAALPLITVLVAIAGLLWYALGVEEGRPVRDAGATVLGFVWIGVLGSYAALLLRAHHGKHLFLAAVLPTVAADIVAYAVGSRVGSRAMAPQVSPGKTWEGTIAGGVAAILVAVLFIGHLAPFTHGKAFELGVVIAIMAPLGDLVESMVKRDLHLKDSGTALPGHGGLLDRFDALLFVLPATYYLLGLLNLYGK